MDEVYPSIGTRYTNDFLHLINKKTILVLERLLYSKAKQIIRKNKSKCSSFIGGDRHLKVDVEEHHHALSLV